jgi:hypothetical protein
MRLRHLSSLLIGAAILLLIGCSTSPSSARAPTPTARVDPTTQTYVKVLETYYVPWVTGYVENRQCSYNFIRIPADQQTAQMQACRPIVATEITAGKTLISQLATAQPPAQWQDAHAALRQAMQAADAYDAQRLQMIDAQNLSQFVSVVTTAPTVFDAFCSPVSTFNVWFGSRGATLLPQPALNCS